MLQQEHTQAGVADVAQVEGKQQWVKKVCHAK
jgi:hypothetical protein